MSDTAVAHSRSKPEDVESAYAWLRLATSLLLMTIGGSGMYSVTVVLPRLQAEFGVDRADASLPYTFTMIGFGVGSARLRADRARALFAARGGCPRRHGADGDAVRHGAGRLAAGAVFDLTGSYRAAFVNGIGWNLLNMSIVGLLLYRVTTRARARR